MASEISRSRSFAYLITHIYREVMGVKFAEGKSEGERSR